jgi:hypothetical protein
MREMAVKIHVTGGSLTFSVLYDYPQNVIFVLTQLVHYINDLHI